MRSGHYLLNPNSDVQHLTCRLKGHEASVKPGAKCIHLRSWDRQFINLICIWHVMQFPRGKPNLPRVKQMKTWGAPHFEWGGVVRHMAVSPDERLCLVLSKLLHGSREKPPPCTNPAGVKGHCPSCQSEERSVNRGLSPSVGWNPTNSLCFDSSSLPGSYFSNRAACLEWRALRGVAISEMFPPCSSFDGFPAEMVCAIRLCVACVCMTAEGRDWITGRILRRLLPLIYLYFICHHKPHKDSSWPSLPLRLLHPPLSRHSWQIYTHSKPLCSCCSNFSPLFDIVHAGWSRCEGNPLLG